MNILLIMPEYCSSCLWEIDENGVRKEIEPEAVGLPEPIKKNLLDWNMDYTTRQEANDFSWDAFTNKGLCIAEDISKFLNSQFEVRYMSYSSTCDEILQRIHVNGRHELL